MLFKLFTFFTAIYDNFQKFSCPRNLRMQTSQQTSQTNIITVIRDYVIIYTFIT